MKWRAQPDNLKPKRFEIEHDPVIGFYLYVFEGKNCIGDYLQDTFEVAIERQAPRGSTRPQML